MKMDIISFFVIIAALPKLAIGCKSKTPKPIKPPCPEGYWEVPEGWKCNGADKGDCFNNQNCMNYAYLCNGRRNLRRDGDQNNSDSNYVDGSPDENLCTDQFCLRLKDGRSRRCSGTTRCITPTENYFEGTDIPIGPICAEELYSQFESVELDYVNGSSMIQCKNGELAKVGDGKYHGMFLRGKISRRCRGLMQGKGVDRRNMQKGKPFCTDHSDVTAKTCAWACLHFTSTIEGLADNAWPCPGEAKCIARHQICDGISDCGNGQDEDENLCTDDFCKNGYVYYDSNHINYTTADDDHGYYRYLTDPAESTYDYIFSEYRWPNYPPNQMTHYRKEYGKSYTGKVLYPNLQNIEMPKCKNSTKCLRRDTLDDDAHVQWIEC